MNIDINSDEIKKIKKKYKKLQKYMRSPLYQVKVMDGNEKTVSNLLKEDKTVT